jgi:hypothetical protein
LAVESVNTHLEPIRARRRNLVQHPERLREIIQHGAQKASQTAEATMSAAREAVGVLTLSSAAARVSQKSDAEPLRVPESITNAKTDEEKWTLRTQGWLERVSKVRPLRKDRLRTFITRRGRKVGVHAAAEENGLWKFEAEDRPVNVLVLIAQDQEGFLHDYILPPKVLSEYWKKFQRRDDSVEITAKKAANTVSILLDDGDLPIQQYEGNYAALE